MDKKRVGTQAAGVSTASIGGATANSRTRVMRDVQMEDIQELQSGADERTWWNENVKNKLAAFPVRYFRREPPAVESHKRSIWHLVPARGDRLMVSPNAEQHRHIAQLLISRRQHQELLVIPLSGAGSQDLPFLSPLSADNPFALNFPIPLEHSTMEPVAFIGLGAGAFVAVIVVGIVLFHRRATKALESAGVVSSRKAVEVDVEKAPAEGILERREPEGTGWKEYTGSDEKSPQFSPNILAPLVVAFQKESDVTEAPHLRTPLSTEIPFPAPPRWQALPPAPNTPLRSVPPAAVPLLEGDISDTRESDYGPAVPPGLDVAKPRAGVQLEPLDTEVSRLASWPVLVPTPADDLRAVMTSPRGQAPSYPAAEHPPGYVALPSSISETAPGACSSTETLGTSPASDVQELLDDAEDPFSDPVDPLDSPSSESLLVELQLVDYPPTYIPRADEMPPVASESDSEPVEPTPIEVEYSHELLLGSTSVVEAFAIPLPDSLPPSPILAPPLLPIHYERLQTPIGSQTEYEAEGEPSPSSSSSVSMGPLHIQTFPDGHRSSTIDSDETDFPTSPLSMSSASSYSSGPDTPTELKQDLLFGSALGTPYKRSPAVSIVGERVEQEEQVFDEVVNVQSEVDPVKTCEQAPDPPVPTVDSVPEPVAPEWVLSLPGTFESSALSAVGPGTKMGATPVAMAEVSLLTSDMVQLCYVLLAMSNCAGLVAQFAVGFSLWWSFMSVPQPVRV